MRYSDICANACVSAFSREAGDVILIVEDDPQVARLIALVLVFEQIGSLLV